MPPVIETVAPASMVMPASLTDNADASVVAMPSSVKNAVAGILLSVGGGAATKLAAMSEACQTVPSQKVTDAIPSYEAANSLENVSVLPVALFSMVKSA